MENKLEIINKRIDQYFVNRNEKLFNRIISEIDSLISNKERAYYYLILIKALFLKRIEDKQDLLIEKLFERKLGPSLELDAYVKLFHITGKDEYLDIIRKKAYGLYSFHRFSFSVIEAFALLNSVWDDYSIVIRDYISIHKDDLLSLSHDKRFYISFKKEIDTNYEWLVNAYEALYRQSFHELSYYVADKLWDNCWYDECFELLRLIDNRKDTFVRTHYYNRVAGQPVYYRLACYYLISGEERFDVELGYYYYQKYKEAYGENADEEDLKNKNLQAILKKHSML